MTTIDQINPGTIVHLASRGACGYYLNGRTVRVQGPTEARSSDPVSPEANRFYVWKAFQQGKTVIHGSTPCVLADDPDQYRF